MDCNDCRDLLSPHLDGELPPEDAAAVSDHLARCPDCARAHDALAAVSRRLQEGLVSHRVPDVLKARIRTAIAQRDAEESRPVSLALRRWARLAAAAVVIAAASSAATVALVRHAAATASVSSEVLASHVRSLMPGHLVDVVSSDQHNVKPWFNGRVNQSPRVPPLDAAGFRLVGGRLDYLAAHPVAVVVYARREHVINVYSWPDPGAATRQSATEAQGYHLVQWRSDGVQYWAVSDLNLGELSQFLTLFRGGGE